MEGTRPENCLEAHSISTAPLDIDKALPDTPEPSKWSGWRLAIRVLLSFTSIVLVVNVSLLGWGLSKSGSATGIVKLYEGSCDSMRSRFPWMHLPINVCGTLLLASGNAAMQIILAPTRVEIDRAHPRKPLDIGLMGTKNWPFLMRWRQIVWLLLAVSSLPLQTMYEHAFLNSSSWILLGSRRGSYNSTIFSTTSSVEYKAWIVTQDFISSPTWMFYPPARSSGPWTRIVPESPWESSPNFNNYSFSYWSGSIYHDGEHRNHFSNFGPGPFYVDDKLYNGLDKATKGGIADLIYQTIAVMLQQLTLRDVKKKAENSSLTKMSISDCIRAFNSTLQASFSNVYVVVGGREKNSSLLDGFQVSVNDECSLCWTDRAYCHGQVCDTNPSHCRCAWPSPEASSTLMYNGTQSVPLNAPVQYCLAENAPEHCSIQLHVGLLACVVICNIMKCLCLFKILRQRDFDPLLTVGDGIASFMTKPELETENCGPVSEDYMIKTLRLVWIPKFQRMSKTRYTPLSIRRPPRPKRRLWFAGASRARWISALVL